MYTKKKPTPKKMLAGGIVPFLPSIAQGALGIGQTLFGGSQRKEAKQRLEELRKAAPNMTLPPSLVALANEPVAEEYMEAQELGAQRRTANAADILSRGGSRGLANLGRVMDSERVGEMQRAGIYNQERNRALQGLGGAEERLRNLKVDQYQRDVDAAQQSLDAGAYNMFGGFGQMGRALTFAPWDGLVDEETREEMEDFKKSYAAGNETIALPSKPRPYNKGGVIPPMKTKGEFNHSTNEKTLVDDNTGEVEAKLSGGEVVLNPEQWQKMLELASAEDGELSKFYLDLHKKFSKESK